MSHKVFRKLSGVVLMLVISSVGLRSALAAPGSLDPTFDSDGKVTTNFDSGPTEDVGHAMAIQPDGKIVVAGFSSPLTVAIDFGVARYNSNGSLDTTFDLDGKVTTDLGQPFDIGNAIALQPDGKIVVAGFSGSQNFNGHDFALVRYNVDGSLDTTFDLDGKVITDLGNSDTGYAVAVQTDGKIVVAGETSGTVLLFALVRYNSDGSLDTTFDLDGKVTTNFGNAFDSGRAMALQPDGKIVVAGYSFQGGGGTDFAAARYNTDGSLDTTFDTDGKVTTDFGLAGDGSEAITIQPDGKLLVAGYATPLGGCCMEVALVRYNPDGSLDPGFDTDGKVITASGNFGIALGVALQPDGRIVAAGQIFNTNSDIGVLRYNTDGSLDLTFDTDGIVITDFNSGFGQDVAEGVALQPDSKIVVAGSSSQTGNALDFAVVRYDADITATQVIIDVKPGRFPNRIELEKNICKDDDNLYVAIITTPSFDSATVDVSTLKLGDPLLSGRVTPIRSRARDVDLDGDLDLALAFPLCDLVTSTALNTSTTELVLTGMTLDGVTFTGTDSVKVVSAGH